MTLYVNLTEAPIYLSNGGVIAPGDEPRQVELPDEDKHLIDAGHLAVSTARTTKKGD
jgi:hypothetical protein